jgi:hypothetical protein
LNAPSTNPIVLAPLQRLTRRVRWKRWLTGLHRFAWLMTVLLLGLFLADLAFGMRTLTLRIALSAFVLTAATLLVAVGWRSWFSRLDLLGLAQLLEKHDPKLSERLLTLVQIESAPGTNAEFASLLAEETAQQLANVQPESACPLTRERKRWAITAPVLAFAFIGLAFVPAFAEFSGRFFSAWLIPLAPYRIELVQGNGYALRGSPYTVEAKIVRQDPYAPPVTTGYVVWEDERKQEMSAQDADRFALTLANLQEALRCRVAVGDVRSELIEVQLVDPPVLTAAPVLVVAPPSYVAKAEAQTHALALNGPALGVLQFSQLTFAFVLDVPCRGALVLESTSGEKVVSRSRSTLRPGDLANQVVADVIAATAGKVRATLELDLAHGLSTSIPVGEIGINEDGLPRFTQPLRFLGAANAQASQSYRMAPEDVIRLETEVADDEGLSAIDVEVRVNDDPARIVKWIKGEGKTQIAIHERLPLPRGLKIGDRVRFRLRAADNRVLKRGEIDGETPLPPSDLLPQTAIAPEKDDAWIQLHVDPKIESFVKEQADTQREEVRSKIESIKKKILQEAGQVEALKRGIHLQAALTLDQRMQADKLQTLNRDIVDDLVRAGQQLALNTDLARFAEQLQDIAEMEMQQAGEALARFSEKDRPLAAAEKELQLTHDALMLAVKKLDRMHDWNKMLAQERLDQSQLDKLAQRQQDLADKLEALRAKEDLSEAEQAKQIEEIRQEQAKLARKTEELQNQSPSMKESLAALERQRIDKLAQAAEKLAAEQRAMQGLQPEKMSARMKERLQELAKRQAELAARVKAKPAADAADALKKPNLDNAIERQKEQERQLKDALGKLLPGVVTNALREQILQLVQKQIGIRTDLERVGEQLTQLNPTMLKDRLKDLVTRERELRAEIAKLPLQGHPPLAIARQQMAEQSAQKAADLLAVKDALESFYAMEKTQQELEFLAAMLPATLVKDRSDVKDPAVLAQIERTEQQADEQKELRKDTEKLRSDWMKEVLAKEGGPVREKTAEMAKELLELAQKGKSPESKAMAKQAAVALDQAKKAMEAGKDGKGSAESVEKQNAEAAKQLEIAVKQLQKFAKEQAMQAAKSMKKAEPEKTAQALKDSLKEMKTAESKLPGMPKDAQTAMQAAAQKLTQAANQASKQSSPSGPPKSGRTPAAKAGAPPRGGSTPLPKDLKLETFQGKAWGELPGELKTQMIQDFRTRYGDEYAEVIQQYFERLAQSPATTNPRPKERP